MFHNSCTTTTRSLLTLKITPLKYITMVKKLEGVRVRGPQWLMQYQIEDLKSNKSVIKTDYNITRKGDLKSIEVYISKNKTKGDFKIEY